MFRLRALCWIGLLACLWTSSVRSGPPDLPDRYAPGLDDAPILLAHPSVGKTLAVWCYRERGEQDLAMAWRDDAGRWTDVAFLGRNDGLDQTSPAVAIDENGTVYVAFSVRETSQVHLSVVAPGSLTWAAPIPLTNPAKRCFAPAVSVVANRLVLAWRTFGGSVEIRHFPLFAPQVPLGINDGPDGVDPLGVNDGSSPAQPFGSS